MLPPQANQGSSQPRSRNPRSKVSGVGIGQEAVPTQGSLSLSTKVLPITWNPSDLQNQDWPPYLMAPSSQVIGLRVRSVSGNGVEEQCRVHPHALWGQVACKQSRLHPIQAVRPRTDHPVSQPQFLHQQNGCEYSSDLRGLLLESTDLMTVRCLEQ